MGKHSEPSSFFKFREAGNLEKRVQDEGVRRGSNRAQTFGALSTATLVALIAGTVGFFPGAFPEEVTASPPPHLPVVDIPDYSVSEDREQESILFNELGAIAAEELLEKWEKEQETYDTSSIILDVPEELLSPDAAARAVESDDESSESKKSSNSDGEGEETSDSHTHQDSDPDAETPDPRPEDISDEDPEKNIKPTGRVAWPTDHRTLTSKYHRRLDPVTKSFWRWHTGLDYGTPCGSKVYAAEDGVIEYAGNTNGGYGIRVVVKHGDNFKTTYSHLSSLKVKPGQQVKTGDVVGLAGTTGNSTGCHLHFEIVVDNYYVNPYSWIYGKPDPSGNDKKVPVGEIYKEWVKPPADPAPTPPKEADPEPAPPKEDDPEPAPTPEPPVTPEPEPDPVEPTPPADPEPPVTPEPDPDPAPEPPPEEPEPPVTPEPEPPVTPEPDPEPPVTPEPDPEPTPDPPPADPEPPTDPEPAPVPIEPDPIVPTPPPGDGGAITPINPTPGE